MLAAASAAHSATNTWSATPGDGLWATTGNWSLNALNNADNIVFGSSSVSTVSTDSRTIANLTINSGAPSYTINGSDLSQTITLTSGVISNSANIQTFNVKLAGAGGVTLGTGAMAAFSNDNTGLAGNWTLGSGAVLKLSAANAIATTATVNTNSSGSTVWLANNTAVNGFALVNGTGTGAKSTVILDRATSGAAITTQTLASLDLGNQGMVTFTKGNTVTSGTPAATVTGTTTFGQTAGGNVTILTARDVNLSLGNVSAKSGSTTGVNNGLVLDGNTAGNVVTGVISNGAGSGVTPTVSNTVTASTSQTITLTSATGFGVGMSISGTGIAAGTVITGISGNVLTLSQSTSSPTGTITGATVSVANLSKAGSGTWSLTGANTYTGVTNVNGGTLKLDFANSSITTDILYNGFVTSGTGVRPTATVGGGTLLIAGKDGTANVQNLGQIRSQNSNPGAGNVTLTAGSGGTLAVNATTIGSSTTASLNFNIDANSTLNFSQATANSMAGQRIFINGNDYAFINASKNLVASGTTGYGNSGSAIAAATATNNGSYFIINGDLTRSAAMPFRGLKITSSGGTNQSLDLGGFSTSAQNGSILYTGGGTANYTIKNGSLMAEVGSSEIMFYIANGATLNVDSTAAVTDNGAILTSISKVGDGTTVVSGGKSFTGKSCINAGTYSVDTLANGGINSGLGASSNAAGNLFIGGTLKYTGTTTSTDRSFTVMGTGATLDASGTGALTWAPGSALVFLQSTNSATSTTASQNQSITFTGTSTADNTFGSSTGILADPTQGMLSVIKSGTGKWILNQANTYTGGTNIGAGTLNFTTGGLGSTGAVTFTGNSTLQYGSATTTDLSSRLVIGNGVTGTVDTNGNNVTFATGFGASGSGALIKIGTGTLSLNAANTYTGLTTVNAGTLAIGSGGSLASGNALTLGASGLATFDNVGQTLDAVTNANTTTDALNFTASTGTVTLASLSGSGNTTFGSNGVVTGGISSGTITSVGNLTANISGGTTTVGGLLTGNISSGTVGAGSLSASSVSGGTNTITGAAGVTTLSSGTTTVGGVATIGTLSGGTVNFNGATSSVTTLNGGTVNLGGSTVLTVSNGTTSGMLTGTGGSLTKTSSGTLTLNGTNSYTGLTTVSAGTLSVGSGGSLASGNELTLGASGLADFANAGQTLGAVSNANTTSNALNFTASTGTVTLGSLSGAGNTTFGSLASIGTLSAGTVNLNGSTSAITTLNGGTVNLGSSSALTVSDGTSSGAITGTGGSLTKISSGTLTLNGTNTYTGGTNLSAGTLNFTTGGLGTTGAVTFTGNATLQYGSATTTDLSSRLAIGNGVTGTVDTNGNNVTFAIGFGASGSGALTKLGSGTLSLNAANTYTGLTTVNAGTLSVGSGGSMASGNALTLGASGSATFGNANQTLGTVSNANTTSNALNFTATSGTVTLASLSGAGSTRFGSDGVVTGGISAGTVTSVGNLTANITGGTNTVGGLLTSNISSGTVGAGSLSATTVSGGTNTITGAAGITTLSNGTTTVGGVATIGTLSGGTANLNGATSAITTLSGGTVNLGSSTVLTVCGGTTSGAITGNGGSLTKSGSGTLTLSGTNTFTGATTLSGGTLAFNAAAALGSTSGINLTDTTTLTYTGAASTTFDRDIAVTSGTGFLRNSGAGTLTLSGGLSKNGTVLTFAEGSFDVTGAISGASANSDLVVDAATVTLSIANTFNGPTLLRNGATLNATALGALPTGTRTALVLDDTGTGGSTLNLSANQVVASLTGASSSTVDLKSNTLTVGTTSGSTTFSGTLSNSSGTGSLIKDGASTLTLTNANTYDGTTTVSAGVLNIQNASALGSTTGGTTVASGAALHLQNSLSIGAEALSLNGTGVGNTGALRSLSGTTDFGGLITLAGSARINADAGTLRLSNLGTITGAGFDLTVGGAGDTTIAGVIGTTTGTLTKDGAGTLALLTTNTLSGTITISAGSLQLGDRTTLNGSVAGDIINNAALVFANPSSQTYAGAISGTGSVTKNGSGALTLTGTHTFTGTTAINQGTVILSAGSLGGTDVTVGSGSTPTASAGNAELTISGNRTLGTSSAGSLTINGGNTGGTPLGQGTLSLLDGGINTLTLANSTSGATNLTLGGTSGNAALLKFDAGNTTTDQIFVGQKLLLNAGGAIVSINQLGGTSLVNNTYDLMTFSSGSVFTGTFKFAGGAITQAIGGGRSFSLQTTATAEQLVVATVVDPNAAYWGGSQNGSWNTLTGTNATNWVNGAAGTDTNQVPTSTTNVFMTADSATNLSTTLGTNFTINSLNFTGTGTAATGSVTVAGNTLTLNATSANGNVAGSGLTVESGSGAHTISSNVVLGNDQTWGNFSANTLTVSGVISGAHTLALTGDFTFSGAAANTFSGSTTLNSGTLHLAKTAGIDALAGNLIVGGGTVQWDANNQINNASNLTVNGGTLALGNFSDTVGLVTLTSGSITGTNGVLTGSAYAVENGSISAILGGGGALTKTTSGTVTLSGANTYTGGTTVSAGTLAFGAANALAGGSAVTVNGGTLALGSHNQAVGAVTLTSGSITGTTGILTGSSYAVESGAISAVLGGSAALTKTTSSTVTLSAANTYTGGTTVSAGTLALGLDNALASGGSVTVNGGTFALGVFDNTVGTVTLTSGSITGSTGVLTGSSYAVESGTISAILGGSGALTKTTAGSVTLNAANTYTGLTTVSAGTLAVGSSGSLFSGNDLTVGAGSAAVFANVGQTLGAVSNANTTNNALNFIAASGTVTLDSLSGTGNTRFGSDAVVTGGISSGTVTSVGDLAANISGGTTTVGGLLTGNISAGTVGAGLLSATTVSGGTTTVTGAAGITTLSSGMTTVGGVATIGTLSGGTANLNGVTSAITTLNGGTVNLGSSTVLTVSDGTTSGTIAGTGGSLTKISSGTLTLNAANTYTGLTMVNAGMLAIGSGGSLASGNALTLGASSAADFANAGQTLGAVSNANTATNALNFSAATGTVTLASLSGAGNTRFGSNGVVSGGIGSGTVTSVGNLTANISGGTTTVGGLLTGNISSGTVGAGSLSATTVSGGTTTVTGAAGITTLSSGTTTVGGVATIGTLSGGIANLNGATSAITTLNGGTVNLGASTTLSVSGGTSAGVIAGTGGSLTKIGSGTLTLTGANTHTGTTTVSAGTLALNAASGATLATTTAVVIGNGAIVSLGAANPINASATLTLNGGTLASNGFNQTLGTLDLNTASALNLGGSAALVFANSSALDWNSSTLSISNFVVGTNSLRFGTTTGGLTATQLGLFRFVEFGNASAQIDSSGFLAPTSANYLNTGSSDLVVSTAITGTTTVDQSGTGTTTLTGTNTSTGTATVSNGTLVIGTVAGGNWAGNVTVGGSGILKGRGDIGGAVLLNSAGTYSPGNSPAIQHIGSLTVNTGSLVTIELDGATAGNGVGFHDQVISAGAVTLNGGTLSGSTIFTGSTGYTPALGFSHTIITGSAVTGTFDAYNFAIANNSAGVTWMPEYTATAVNLFTVPQNYATVAGLTSNQTRLGTALQSFRPTQIDNRTTLTATATLFNGLMRQNAAGLYSAYNQLSPEKFTALSAASSQSSSIFNSSIQERSTELRRFGPVSISLNGVATPAPEQECSIETVIEDDVHYQVAKPKPQRRLGYFANATGAFAAVDAGDDRPGYQSKTGAANCGFDYTINSSQSVGLVVGQYDSATAFANDCGSAQITTNRVGVFHDYHNQGFFVNSAISAGFSAYDAQRKISFLNQTAHGETHGTSIGAQLGAGYDFKIGDFLMGPKVRLAYDHDQIRRFTETGSAADLNVDHQSADSFTSNLGFHISRPIEWQHIGWIPEVSFGVSRQHYSPAGITGRFAAGGDSFVVQPQGGGSEYINPGVSLSALLANGCTVQLSYEAILNNNFAEHRVNLSIGAGL